MAKQEHLDILKQGVEVWNLWRERRPEIQPDLSGANLNGANLSGANLNEVGLMRMNLESQSRLSDATQQSVLRSLIMKIHFLTRR